jgi:hypothetical protein
MAKERKDEDMPEPECLPSLRQYIIINAKSISFYLTKEHLEMTCLSHSPRDRILWILANNAVRWSEAD